MPQLLVVFGATGQQGSSVVNSVVRDPELSKQWKVRGVTRDTSKPAAQELQRNGVEVVCGDWDDEASIKAALQDAHTVFYMTPTMYAPGGYAKELQRGKAIADAAVAAGVQYLIYSSLYRTSAISGGKSTVESFDIKTDVEEYIRSLPLKSAFFAPGMFMQNLTGFTKPRPAGDGTYVWASVHTPESRYPVIDIQEDTGKFVAAMLAKPDEFEGKVVAASSEIYSAEEMARIMTKVTGKTVKYAQLPEATVRGFLPPDAANTLIAMYLYIQDFGYFGPNTEADVGRAIQGARGKLNTLEGFLSENLKLE